MTDFEILLYFIGGLSVIAVLLSLLDVYRRKSRKRAQED